jgi:hypothetical protein
MRIGLAMMAFYTLLVVIVMLMMTGAIASEAFKQAQRCEDDQMLRNRAIIIDEIEGTMGKLQWEHQYVHVLEPDANGAWAAKQSQRPGGPPPHSSSRHRALADTEAKQQLAGVQQQVAELKKMVQGQEAAQQRLMAAMQQLLEQQLHSNLSGSVYGSSEVGQLSCRSTLIGMPSVEQPQQQQQPGGASPIIISRQPSDDEPGPQVRPRLEQMKQFPGARGGGAR